ncbi:ATP-dependent RNA helicase DEAH12, chloroplastic [Caerostris extrusa]|uniref:ATP-dependent RNA helicase DEAH12, chloroplastic n=1 Tax=Caerostris extrusa TaxID=172846 RepID=A0AAV4SST1_CAEEX|nr:ATP-dependent RNA helicase DEAH12, chloroplastic [Caerostris extrusa]
MKPASKDFRWNAWVFFQNSCDGETAVSVLKTRKIDVGQEYIKKLSEAKSKCHIEINLHKKILKLFGNEATCNLLKVEINDFLDQLAEENFKEIVLMDDNKKPGVLRELLNEYGFDLEKLKIFCDLTSIELNSRRHILTVRGSNIAVTKCQQVIQDIKVKLGDIVYEENTELCPVCFDQIANEFHRLEYCGHAYCRECILHWFQTSNDFRYIAFNSICTQCQELNHFGMSCNLNKLSKETLTIV